MRIVSTLPTATEIIYQLGLGSSLVGVSHECNYPKEASKKPRVSKVDFDYGTAASSEIDDYVGEKMHNHHSLYQLKDELVTALAPTHLITQKLCDVCAVTPNDVQRVIKSLTEKPELITLNPTNLEEILKDILMVGSSLGRGKEAIELVEKLRSKIEQIKLKTHKLQRKTIFCVEWIDPPYASGHWIPEMVDIAGGSEVLGWKGKPSRKVSWEDVLKADPEILVFMPCGFSLEKTILEIRNCLSKDSAFRSLRAIRNIQVWVVDGPSYFNQSGPRVLAKGVEILAKIIHPEVFESPTKAEATKLSSTYFL
ncbi:MAG: cobalamin-binding protein [Candidatus Woykebacteria bacterium]